MTSYTIDLRLTILLESPLHIGTGYGHAGYLDAVMTTDAQGRPYVPGSSLKGRLRFYLRQLLPVLAPGDTEAEITLFGNKKQAGALFFDNCVVTKEWADLIDVAMGKKPPHALTRSQAPVVSQQQTNVMLSRRRGVALERRLFTVENAPAHLAFHGRIHGRLPAKNDAPHGPTRTLTLLVAAIRACTHLGGRKSRGLGRCRLEIDKLVLDGREIDIEPLLEALA